MQNCKNEPKPEFARTFRPCRWPTTAALRCALRWMMPAVAPGRRAVSVAGAALAARLSEDPSGRAALLEAGPGRAPEPAKSSAAGLQAARSAILNLRDGQA